MHRWFSPLTCGIVICLALLSSSSQSAFASDAAPSEQLEFFEAKIRPLLVNHCYECHSGESGESAGELLLDSAVAMERGGIRGSVLNREDPSRSLLLQAVSYENPDLEMPPSGKLEDSDIDLLRRWVEMGAPDPRNVDVMDEADDVSPLDRDPSSHWAFVPPQRIDAGTWSTRGDVGAGATVWTRSHDPVDAVAHLDASELGAQPAVSADRATLIRRLYFDLTGLPPTFDDVQAYVGDERPDAYVRLVDRLLAMPGFGERFGRHWMDVARYADTVGYSLAGRERRLIGSEKFRDWVIRSFNDDLPYDEMILHQLAGDRTDPDNQRGHLDAMGFLTVGRRYLSNDDQVDDRIDVVTRGLMGLTVTCARCHDHKFDPIPTVDYYSLYGVFRSSEVPGDADPSPLRMVDVDKPRDYRVLVRGQRGNRGEVATRQYLTSLRSEDDKPFRNGSGRLDLARKIASRDNPLTSRVMVNRVWMHLIGKPLVDSPSDFGFRTLPPHSPEVLDDLAADFSRHWSIKKLVRRIVMTRIYQQMVVTDQNTIGQDPDNRLLARANRRRRDFESMRDAMLQVSGRLDRTMGGTPVEITLPTVNARRTVYALIDRQNLPSLFRTFDLAGPDAHAPLRHYTTVPQQALYLLNHPHVPSIAKSLVKSAGALSGNVPDRLRRLYRHVYARQPTESELRALIDYVNQPPADFQPQPDPRSLWSYGVGESTDRGVHDFRPLPVFRENRYQASDEFPAAGAAGYAFLGSENSHPGNDAKHSVIRRWRVPRDGSVRVTGMIGHRSTKGDGVVVTIWAGDKRLFHAKQKSNNRPLGRMTAKVRAGDFVQFAAAPGDSPSFDGFFWRMTISLRCGDGTVIDADSVKDFSKPITVDTPRPLDRWEQLAQVLLISNEFGFVD